MDATPFLLDDLRASLAGVYRHNGIRTVYVRTGYPDWTVTSAHEFTHLMLGTSTTSGMLHELLFAIAEAEVNDRREHWRELFNTAVAYALDTHEAAATFCSLVQIRSQVTRGELYENYRVGPAYQRWHELLDGFVPEDMAPWLRAAIGRSLAIAAMNDPLVALRRSPETLLAGQGTSLLPRPDERFHSLLRARDDIIPRILHASKQLQPPPLPDQLPVREYYEKRRSATAASERTLVDVIRSVAAFGVVRYAEEESLPIHQEVADAVAQAARDSVPQLPFAPRVTYPSDEGEDLSLYEESVQFPPEATRVDNLVRFNLQEVVPVAAELISIVQPSVDCYLTPALVLRKSQYYTRFFTFESHRPTITPYCITDTFPTAAFQCSSPAVAIAVGPAHNIGPWPVEVDLPADERIVIRPIQSLSRKLIDLVLSDPASWRVGFIPWIGAREVVTVVLFKASSNMVFVTAAMSSPLELFFGEITPLVQRLPDDQNSREIWDLIADGFPFISCGDGAPLAREGAPASPTTPVSQP